MRPRLPKLTDIPVTWSRLRQIHTHFNGLGCSPWRRLVVFDVGANDGASFLYWARLAPWARFFAFEPTPELATRLRAQAAPLKNYEVIEAAVGEAPGRVRFNVAGAGNWGGSSLLEFSDHVGHALPDCPEFKTTHRIEVEMIRLDDFVRSRGISRIDFLHIDAQGSDLSVLRSLGAELGRVRAGVIEVPRQDDITLYSGQHTRTDALNFLQEAGFHPWRIAEDDVYFRRA